MLSLIGLVALKRPVGRRRGVLALLLAAAMCGSGCVSAEGYNNPTVPPRWHLYGGLEIGYAVAMPRDWAGFDLNTQIDLAAGICSLDDATKQLRRQQIANLHDRGVRLFACDQSRDADRQTPLAYAVTGSAPSEGLDKYLDGQQQAQGRDLLERRHVSTNAGDMVIQKVRERLTAPDGTALDTTQYQFMVIRFNAFHLFFIEFPTALQSAVGSDAELMGTSFTPVR